jgi:hypothetical protein
MRVTGRRLVAMLVLAGLACPLAYEQAREARQRDSWFHGWRFDVAPFYLWLPALDGRIAVGETSTSVDQSVGDTLDLAFESLKFAATGPRGSPQRERLADAGPPVYGPGGECPNGRRRRGHGAV